MNRELETLNTIYSLREQHTIPPTLRDLQKGLGLHSNNPVLGRLRKLEKLGWIKRRTRKARGITITAKGYGKLDFGVRLGMDFSGTTK